MSRPYVWDLEQSGATNGQVPVWDNTAGMWVPDTVSGSAADLDDLGDVDTTSTPPSDGDVLTFDSGSGLWLPAAPTGGGGGLTHTYVGYNTAGATSENTTAFKAYLKTFTLASAGVLLNVAAHLRGQNATVGGYGAAVYTDSAGSLDRLIGYSANPADSVFPYGTSAAFRWLSIPLGVYLAAGTYWISFHASDSATVDIAYDTSGTDKSYTSGGAWQADGGFYTITTGTKTYSVRGSILS